MSGQRHRIVGVLVLVAACLLIGVGLWLMRGGPPGGLAPRRAASSGPQAIAPTSTTVPLAESYKGVPDAPRLEAKAADLIAQADDESGTLVVGRVIHLKTRAPIEGVRIEQSPGFDENEIESSGWKVAKPGVSDADGFFTMRLTSWNGLQGDTNSAVLLPHKKGWVLVDDGLVGVPGLFLTESKDGSPLQGTVTMLPAVSISGVVRREDGRPLEGGIRAWRSGDGVWVGSGPLAADGRFSFNVLPHGTYFLDVAVSHYGEVRSDDIDVLDRDVTGIEIVLGRMGQVAGVVLDPDGQPIAGALVGTRRLAKDSRGGPLPWEFEVVDKPQQAESAPTNQRGEFRKSDVQPGRFELQATREGYAASDPVAVELASGQQLTGVELRLRPATFVAGRVLDDKKQPVYEAVVTLENDEGYNSLTLRRAILTDGDGRFRIDDVPASKTWRLGISDATGKEHVWSADAVVTGDPDAEYVLRGNARVTLVVSVLDATTGDPVRLVGVTGNPQPVIEDADLGIFRQDGVRLSHWRWDEAVTVQARGDYLQQTVQARDLDLPADAPDGTILRRTIEMSRGGTFSGRVVAGNPPKPVADVPVMVIMPERSGWSENPWQIETTDGEGRFRVRNVAGSYTVCPHPDPPLIGHEVVFTLAEGEERDLGDLVLDEGRSVTLRIVDANGSPRPGARVTMQRGSDVDLTAYRDSALTDEEGRVVFEHVNNEKTEFLLRDDGLALTIRNPAAVVGEVVVPTGRSALAVRVEQAGQPTRSRHQVLLSRKLAPGMGLGSTREPARELDGWQVMDRLSAGEWEVTIALLGRQPRTLAPRTVTVVDGQRTELVVILDEEPPSLP